MGLRIPRPAGVSGQLPPPGPGGKQPTAGEIRYQEGPGGRIFASEWVVDPLTGNGSWYPLDQYTLPEGDGDGRGSGPSPEEMALGWAGQILEAELGRGELDIGRRRLGLDTELGRGELALNRQGLAETTRSNKAQEVEARRGRALEAASNALSSYLRGTELSDARRLSAAQEARALLPSLVKPGQRYFAGQGPNEALAQASARSGLPFQGSEIVHKQLRPGALAAPPTQGQIGSDIMKYVGNVQRAGR